MYPNKQNPDLAPTRPGSETEVPVSNSKTMSILAEKLVTLQHDVFYTLEGNKGYLVDSQTGMKELPDEQNQSIIYPFVGDTEYFYGRHPIEMNFEKFTITSQIRPVAFPWYRTLIIDHPDAQGWATRFHKQTTEFAPVDALQAMGYKVELLMATPELLTSIGDIKTLPKFRFATYGHFLTTDYAKFAYGSFRKSLLDMTQSGAIDATKRIRCVGAKSWIEVATVPGWFIRIEGRLFKVELSMYDSIALHGVASLADVAQAVGLTMEHKQEVKDEYIKDMKRCYLEKPDLYESYAKQDCITYEILEKYASLWSEVCKSVDVNPFLPKLTIGSTVASLLHGKLLAELTPAFERNRHLMDGVAAYFGVKEIKTPDKLLDLLLEQSNPDAFRAIARNTAALNAKVFGGRARNNRPNEVYACYKLDEKSGWEGYKPYVMSILCDIDISGCYGEGQRNQIYSLGKPKVVSFDTQTGCNDYPTLEAFHKEWGDELVPGCWQYFADSLEQTLKYPQDLIMSWDVPSRLKELLNLSETEIEVADSAALQDWLDNGCGLTKVLTHEIKNGLVNHDLYQIMDTVASPQQRKELMTKLHVKTAVFYPNSGRCKDFDELIQRMAAHTGRNKNQRVGKTTASNHLSDEGYYWIGLNLGDLITSDLVRLRKEAQKAWEKEHGVGTGKKAPLQTLYKLCINTLYGVLVSPFFSVGNVVAGNNITARARALAWAMEAGLYTYQSITDGGIFDINRVVYALGDRRVTMGSKVGLSLCTSSLMSSERRIKLEPMKNRHVDLDAMGGESQGFHQLSWKYETNKDKKVRIPVLTLNTGKVLVGKEAEKWVNKTAMEHLQSLFPKLDILNAESTDVWGNPRKGQFEFEMKCFADEAVFHGTANYAVWQDGEMTNYAMRSYPKKDKYVRLDNTPTTLYPSVELFQNLRSNPTSVPRAETFLRDDLLSVKQWRELKVKGDMMPADPINKPGLLREFSPSQPTFQTFEQRNTWESTTQKLKDKYGQSFENFFINEDGTLNFAKMTDTLARLAADGQIDPLKALKNSNNRHNEHPSFQDYLRAKRIQN